MPLCTPRTVAVVGTAAAVPVWRAGRCTLAHSLVLGNKIFLQADLGASPGLDLMSDLGHVTPAYCLIVSFFICKWEKMTSKVTAFEDWPRVGTRKQWSLCCYDAFID